MNKIEQLIEELCPQGVEFRALGEISRLSIGSFVKKTKQNDDYEYPVYNGGTTPTGYYNFFNSEQNSIVISARGSIGFVNFVTVDFWAGNSCYVLKNIEKFMNHKYLFYYLKHNESNLYRLRQTGSIPAINSGPLSKFQILIPPLTIQKEIVKILDNFTRLEAELEAELEARKKQYEHYREELLSFGDDVEFRAIENLTKDKFWIMPATPKFNASEKTPYITSKNIRGGNIDFTKVKYISRSDYLNLSRNRPILEGDILISMIGTIGEVARVKKTDLYFYGQNMYLIRLDENLINISYFLHYFDSKRMKKHFNATKNKSSQGYLKAKDIEGIQIPIPPLSKQKEIVTILDKFDALVNDISTGLPAEIAARKKQYEYYRNQLLTFKPLELQDAN